MKNIFLFIAISILAVFAQTTFASDLTPAMHQNFQALLKLQQYVVSADEFNDPKNAKEIQENIDALASVAKQLPKMMGKEKPGLQAISALFSDYILNTKKNFQAGYREYARHQIRTTTGFCMACHTSGQFGQQFMAFQKLPNAKEMSSLEKAEFFTATRQFDEALNTYERLIFEAHPSTEKNVVDMVRAIRTYLSMSVRVKQDPKLSFGFLTKVEQAKNLIQFFERDLQQWKADLTTWMKERKFSVKEASPENLLARGKALIEAGRKRQLFPADHSGDISYLRATNYAHEALNKQTTEAQRAEAFFILGRSYAALSDPFLWELDGLYFEACIRTQPHTALAKQCFKHLASDVYLGYSGSSGTHIPTEDLSRLSTLRKLAE